MSTATSRPAELDKKPPVKWVTKDELRPGDLLFSSSNMTGVLGRIVWLGQVLDGVGYSHCAIFDGEEIVETQLKTGVNPIAVDEALKRNRYTDIHRFLADDGKSILGDPDCPPDPVTQAAHGFIGREYSVGDAVVAALLLIIRKSVHADWVTSQLIRETLEKAVKYLRDLVDPNDPSCDLTCSEFLYRAFDEAVTSDKYRVAIGEKRYASVVLPSVEGREAAADELIEIPIYERMPFAAELLPPSASCSGEHAKLVNKILDLAAEFEARFREVNKCAGPALVPTEPESDSEPAFAIQFDAVADYVSPGDLVRSRNTREIGRIKKPNSPPI